MRWRILPFLLFLATGAGAADSFIGKVTRVLDGRTVVVSRDGRSEVVRLFGVATPAEGEYGFEATRHFAEQFALLHLVTVESREHYAGLVGDVRLTDGRSLREALLQNGMARWDSKNASDDEASARLEAKAREEKRGLWALGEFPATVGLFPLPAAAGRLVLRVGGRDVLKDFKLTAALVSLEEGRCPAGGPCGSQGGVWAVLRLSCPGLREEVVRVGWTGLPDAKGAEYAGLLVRFTALAPEPGPGKRAFNEGDYTGVFDVCWN